MTDHLLDAALEYAARGWPVFPLEGKEPITSSGVKDATTDERQIREWWRDHPRANIGLACGEASAVVVDDDGPKAKEAIAEYARVHGIETAESDLSTSRTKTAKGEHLYFSWSDGCEKLKNWTKPIPDTDIRTTGGYVVAPPSIHPDTGEPYTWIVSPDNLRPFPSWLIDLLLEAKVAKKATDRAALEAIPAAANKQKVARMKADEGHPYGKAALEREIATLRATSEGERNNTLNTAALKLFSLVKGGALGRGEVERELTRVARSLGLKDPEISKTLESAWTGATAREIPDDGPKATTSSGAVRVEGGAYVADLPGGERIRVSYKMKNWFVEVSGAAFKPAIVGEMPIWFDIRKWEKLPEKLGIDPGRWDQIRGDVRTLEERRQGGEEEGDGDEGPEVSEEIKKKAREILEAGDPIKARCDYVAGTVEGNTGVAKVFIYSCSSAYMPAGDKLHSDAVGASQGGKSVTVGAVHSTYPPENLEILTEASPKSVYYLAKRYEEEGRSFDDVILYINDARVEHIPVLKVFRDDGPGSPRNLTVVDGESLDLVVPGRPIVQSSSVLPLRDDEGQAVSRSFLATVADVDEDGEQKVREKIRQGLRYGALLRPETDTKKAVLQQMGRILRDEGIRDVLVPFDAPEPSSADRRGTGQFVRLVKISAHENQFQRPILEMNDGRRFVIATYADLQNAADLWFEFEEAQAFKINHKVLTVFKSLPTTEPDHYNFTGASPSKNRVAKDTGLSPKSVGRYLSDLYDAGLIYRKKAGAPGNPHVFWTTDQLRQKVMSQISATGDGEGELGQIETKNGCPKYLGKNCPDSLKDSSKAFFTNQDIIKKENVKGVSGISASGRWSVSGEKIISSLDFLANRVLNTPFEAADSEYLRHGVLSQMSEIPSAIDSKMGVILSREGENVSKDDPPSSVDPPEAADEPRGVGELAGVSDPDDYQSIAEGLEEAARREAAYLEKFKTPEPKAKGRRLERLYDVPRYAKNYGILYQPAGKALEYSPWAANVAKSCSHGCEYCYAPAVARKTGDKYRDVPDPKTDLIKRINAGLTRALEDGCNIPRVHLTFAGDFYDPRAMEGSEEFSSSEEMTRAVIEAIHSHGVGVQILTKGREAARDFDLLGPRDRFGVSLTFLDPEKSKEWEPGAALPDERIENLRGAKEKGLTTWVSLEPVIDPAATLELVRRSAEYVDIFAVGKWNHDKRADKIDWHKFAADVVKLLESLGCDYYIKDDLKRYLPSERSETKKVVERSTTKNDLSEEGGDGRIFNLSQPYWRDLAKQHHGLNTRVLKAELGYDDLKAGMCLDLLRKSGWITDYLERLQPPGYNDDEEVIS